MVTGAPVYEFSPIQKRIGSDMDVHIKLDGSCEVKYRGEATTENKETGPTSHGFILKAQSINNLSTFKLSRRPYDWKEYPEKEQYPWYAEFHVFSTGSNSWLAVSIWCGPSTDQDLVREMLVAASKSAQESKKIADR